MSQEEIKSFTLGQTVRLRAEFRDDLNVLTDPDALTFKCKPAGGGDLIEYIYGTDNELVRESTGKFYVHQTVETAGTWFYKYRAVKNSLVETIEREFVVEGSQF
jgi:hypothetical protein